MTSDESFQRAVRRRLPPNTGAIPTAPLEAHARWIADLREYIYGGGTFDPGTAARDDLCEVGQWLDGDGAQFRHLAAYEAARVAHARFHQCAAAIVDLAQEGRRADAERSLSQRGLLRRHSIALVAAFSHLNRVIAEQNRS